MLILVWILVRILVLALILWIVYRFISSVYRTWTRFTKGFSMMGGPTGSFGRAHTVPFSRKEKCPACGAPVRLPEKDTELQCPACGEKLARGPEGKLLIRLN